MGALLLGDERRAQAQAQEERKHAHGRIWRGAPHGLHAHPQPAWSVGPEIPARTSSGGIPVGRLHVVLDGVLLHDGGLLLALGEARSAPLPRMMADPWSPLHTLVAESLASFWTATCGVLVLGLTPFWLMMLLSWLGYFWPRRISLISPTRAACWHVLCPGKSPENGVRLCARPFGSTSGVGSAGLRWCLHFVGCLAWVGCGVHSHRGRVLKVTWRYWFSFSLGRCHRGSHGRGRRRAWGRGQSASLAPLQVGSTLPGLRAAWRVSCHGCCSLRAHGSRKCFSAFGAWVCCFPDACSLLPIVALHLELGTCLQGSFWGVVGMGAIGMLLRGR